MCSYLACPDFASFVIILQQPFLDICAVLGVVSNLEMLKSAQEDVHVVCPHNANLQRGLEQLQTGNWRVSW